jgi:CubicO group peptidase (beta-lactamase class C family)
MASSGSFLRSAIRPFGVRAALSSVLILAVSNLLLLSCQAQDQFEQIRSSLWTKMAERNVPSLAVAVAKGDKILWEEGFGWADREKRIPADAHTMYSLASISKSLTATALMTLVQSGRIDLDKPVNEYLGSAKVTAHIGNAKDATVRRVANHSAGLPEHFQFFYENEAWRAPVMDETILRFGNLLTPPGERFQYSNLGYGILSDVIARVSGKSFADYMRQEVFLKLGMTRSAVGRDPALREFEAIRYDGEDVTPIVYYDTDHPGASEIFSSAHDLALFGMFSLKAHLQEQAAILPDEAIDAMQRPTMSSRPGVGYGIGWEQDTTAGAVVVSHSGGMPGVATWLRLLPKEKLVIVVLSNEDDRLAHIIADQITSQLVPEWKPPAAETRHPGAVPLHEFVGTWNGSVQTYRSTTPFQIRISGNGEVRVQLGSQLATLLDHVSFDDGILRGLFRGDIDIPEAARRPYVVSLNLQLRNGNDLNGAVTVRADGVGTMKVYNVSESAATAPPPARVEKDTFVLTQWAELKRQKDLVTDQ